MANNLMQNTPEWFEFRKNKIGASDAPIIMGMSPFKTADELWQEKVGIRENRTLPHMQRGHDLEEEARQAFEKETKIIVFPQVKVSVKHDFMIASLDGMDMEEKHFVEIKCPGVKDHEIALRKKIPEKYYPQLQHQIAVTGLDMGYYFSYRSGSTAIIEIRRDNEFIERMIDEEKKFHKSIMDFSPPDYTSAEMTDDEWKELAIEYCETLGQMTSLESRQNGLKERLINLAKEKNVKSANGFGIFLSKVSKQGLIDYKSIPELASIDLEKYRKKPSEYWKISRG